MSTLEKITAAFQSARGVARATADDPEASYDHACARAAIGYLGTFIGDVELERTRGRTMGEPEVQALVKKYRDNASTMHESSAKLGRDSEAMLFSEERYYWSSLLPELMNEKSLGMALEGLYAQGLTNKGQLMQRMKVEFPGQFDGRVLALLVDEMLMNKK